MRKKIYYQGIIGIVLINMFGAPIHTVQAYWNQAEDNSWWYRDDSDRGYAAGWVYIEENWYYFDENGWMRSGWVYDENAWYFCDGAGAMVTGWLQLGDSWYYLKESGAMAYEEWIGNYYLSGSGEMAVNQWVGDYYVEGDGAWNPHKGTWMRDAVGWWYQYPNGGFAADGWSYIDGKWYFFDRNGYMMNGWLQWNHTWFYLEDTGEMTANEWEGDYFLQGTGEMAVSQWIDEYYVGPDGRWRTDIPKPVSETIIIPGLKKEYKLLHITDTHTALAKDNESERIKKEAYIRGDGTNNNILPYFIEYANRSQVDGLLLGGDIISFPSNGNLNELSNSLSKLKSPYLYTLGNHDWSYSWEYHTKNTEQTYKPLFNRLMNNNPAFQIMEFEEFRVVAVDNSKDQINPDAIEGFRRVVEDEKPVIVILHVPLFADSLKGDTVTYWKSPILLGEGGIKPNQVSREFLNLVEADNSPVMAVIAGHIHFRHKDRLKNGIMQYVTGTAIEGDCTMFTIKGN